MKNILIINGHHVYEGFSSGNLNQTYIDNATEIFNSKGYNVKITKVNDQNYNVPEEVDKHIWADYVFIQFPINWMQTPWSFKKYMDDVYTAAMNGQLCNGDGRTRNDPSKQYGSGGTAENKKYMFSITSNAPEDAFNDPDQTFFEGKSIDDVYFPLHLNYKFFAMKPLPTFVSYDVLKNPEIEKDLVRFKKHIEKNF